MHHVATVEFRPVWGSFNIISSIPLVYEFKGP